MATSWLRHIFTWHCVSPILLNKKRLIRDQICHNMTNLFSTRRSLDDVYELIPYKRNPRRNQDRSRIPLYLCCWPWPISITISLILFRSAVRKVIDNFTPLKSIPLLFVQVLNNFVCESFSREKKKINRFNYLNVH